MYLMATMYSFTHDPTLLQDSVHGGAIDIYQWLLTTDLLNRQTGYQRDTLDTANQHCQLYGGVNKSPLYVSAFLHVYLILVVDL